ncbi:EpsD family peptidyl-prolyl cis-trans isomerase [Duganella sp. 1224]|uniref:EpsD family peptidyl-prolyl cis-trans isomerase n=1 Tax=Duganella sp. 1224 TaxID=2587052 RepID=UPI0015CA0541|nr:EpsD family peptidyl-prolyl cis-trans isomerase [Duganella sp. 1224]NYE62166.1 EpsD family peptidyl-prolyl cis-trans isomerase [Duganella sp. 1224]
MAVLVAAVALAGCGQKEKKSGQALVSVNGEEITASQLNDELQRAGVTAEQQAAASKQLMDGLIERQLLLAAAVNDKLDRDPAVVQSIERAKALIIAQAYLQKRVGPPAKPSAAEVDEYYRQHPEFFSERKQFDLRQLVLATKDLDESLSKQIDSKKTLDELAELFDARGIKYSRNQVSRTSADVPPALSAKLQALAGGQIFIVREGERSILNSIVGIKPAPVALEQARPQIEQYLVGTKNKQAVAAEVARLRAAAKIEYLNKALAPDAKADNATPAAAAKPDAATQDAHDAAARGVAGLK